MCQSMLLGEVEIKTLGRGLHHSALFPLPSYGYCSLETAISGSSIMKLDPLCAYRWLALLYLKRENYSDIAIEHGNARLRT